MVSKERILAQMRTKVGQPYSDQVVEQDVEALYKTGAILNVRIFAEPEGDGVKVTVAVQTRSIVREIVIDGAERIKAQKLRKEIKLRLNQPINEQQLEEARQKNYTKFIRHMASPTSALNFGSIQSTRSAGLRVWFSRSTKERKGRCAGSSSRGTSILAKGSCANR
jgi:Outer membrane protein/protective antigen OMA87